MDYTVADYSNSSTGLAGISNPINGQTALVTNPKISGIFIYRSGLSSTNNKGTVIFGWERQYSSDINALWFGATGNGSTDDRDAVNNAIQYAASVKSNVFFPSGTYKFDSEEIAFGNIPCGIKLQIKSEFKIYGEEGTVFKTNKTGVGNNDQWSFLLIVNCQNITIEGINFENNHAENPNYNPNDPNNPNNPLTVTTTNQPRGIYIINGNSNNITIRYNTFSGFYHAILLNGGKNTKILQNNFLSYYGHDDSSNNDNPAVNIRVISSTGNINKDIIVKNNYAEGYSGSDISKTVGKRSMDGFYFGFANGTIIENNTILYFGAEAIYSHGFEIDGPETAPDVRPTIIRGNYIDSDKPSGSVYRNSNNPLNNRNNFGIRADGSNHIIENNYIRAGYGIMCYGIIHPIISKNVIIRNNRYFTDGSTYDDGSGNEVYNENFFPVLVQGYKDTTNNEFLPAKDYIIENNEINIVGISLNENLNLFTIADANYFSITNNKIYIDNVIQNSKIITIYNYVKDCNQIDYGLHYIIGNYNRLIPQPLNSSNSSLNYLEINPSPPPIT